MTLELRRKTLEALNEINQRQQAELEHPETPTRIAQYELEFRMQTSVPEVMDISKEPQTVLDDYGSRPGESSYTNNCLLARRLVEQGVRFVHLFDWGWDFHGTHAGNGIGEGLTKKMAETDRPTAALILDLKQSELGGFYFPIHQRQKVAGQSNAWDFVQNDPALPRVLLIGDSVSQATTPEATVFVTTLSII